MSNSPSVDLIKNEIKEFIQLLKDPASENLISILKTNVVKTAFNENGAISIVLLLHSETIILLTINPDSKVEFFAGHGLLRDSVRKIFNDFNLSLFLFAFCLEQDTTQDQEEK